MNTIKGRNIFLIFTVIIIVLVGIFAIQVYSSSKSSGKISSDKINISEAKGVNQNEVVLSVDAGSNAFYYSFDGGISWGTNNSYTMSENKDIKVLIKDRNNNLIGEKEYKVEVVNHKGPKITITGLSNIIYVGDAIDLSQYAKATDENGNPIAVTYEPQTINTNVPGKYTITYKAVDSNNLTAVLTLEINVIEKNSSNGNENGNNKQKQTYYSYRTKSITTYDCNYYQCDYIDYNSVIDGTIVFDQNSYCCNVEGCKKTNPRIDVCELCVERTGIICPFCHESFTSEYAAKDNICYSKKPLTKPITPENGGMTNLYNLELKTECDSNEIKIDGVCHKFDSYGKVNCPNEYKYIDGKCYKEVKKTCANQCVNESWSDWSSWSTVRVVPNENTEVKTMEK